MSAEESDRTSDKANAEEPVRSSDDAHYFALAKGARLFEFEIEEVLGHGGFGITYLAMDTHLQERVAIKEYLPNDLAVRASSATVRPKSASSNADFAAGLKAFLEEARLVARIRHTNVIRVRRFFEFQGTGYIVQDYEEGATLSQRLSKGPMPEPELRAVLLKVLDGLEIVHERAILHRDIKPSNIMLRKDNVPVLIDFGAARDFASRHSRSVTAIASPGYTPPEQFGIGGEQGPWTDIYALGAVMYRCVTGKAPMDSLRRLRTDSLVPASNAAEGEYGPAFLELIDWMLKIDESERPASVKAVREALNDSDSGGALHPKSSSEIKRVERGRAIIELPKTVEADVLELAFLVTPPGKYLGFSPKEKVSWRVKPHYFEIYSTKGNPEFSSFEIGEKIDDAIPANAKVKISSADDFIKVSSKWPERDEQDAGDQDGDGGKISPQTWRKIAVGAGAALILLIGSFVMFKQDEANFLAAQHSQEAIAAYLQNCSAFCFSRGKAEARIQELKNQKELVSWEQRLQRAGTNISALDGFLRDCGSSCPPAIRAQALKQLDQLRAASAAEDNVYRSARGNITLLNSYIANCKACTSVMAAREEIRRLEEEQDLRARTDRERSEYLNASGNLSALRRYLSECRVCEYRSAVQTQIARLEHDAQLFKFTVCNRSRIKGYVVISGKLTPASAAFKIAGYYSVDPGACRELGNWAKGSFWYMAMHSAGGWRGSIPLCVSATQAFERDREPGERACRAGDKFEHFFMRDITGDFTWTITN